MNIFRRLGRPRVYADAAAATPLSRAARRELERLLALYGNAGALHAEATQAKRELEAARETVARAIGAHADEIVFTASGTEANNLALQGALRPLLLRGERPQALTSAIEHSSVLEPLRALAREGLQYEELGVDRAGVLDMKALAEALRPETALVSVQLVNSEVGTIEPIKEIAKLLRKQERKVLVHTDAAQAPLWLPLNVEKLGVDMMTLDAQKVMGPKGVGCLYVRRGTPLEPMLWGGKQEGALRGGTENVPLIGAFVAALAEAQKHVERRAAKANRVRDYLWKQIKRRVPDAILNGPEPDEGRVANNLNVSVPGLEAQMAVVSLDALGVAASTRSACSVGDTEPSHVISALMEASGPPRLDSPRVEAGTAIRITLLPDATHAQARRIARALAETAQRYRRPAP